MVESIKDSKIIIKFKNTNKYKWWRRWIQI